MKKKRFKVLLIEDNPDHALLIQRHLASVKDTTIESDCAERLSAGLQRLADDDEIDAVLLDLQLPDSQAMGTLLQILEQAPDTPVIVLTALDDVDLATRAVQEGAQDYLVKSQISGDLLVRSIRYSVERKWAEQRLKALNETLEQRVAERTAVAEQRAMQLRELASELIQTEQRERRRLAEVLHDHLQQLLVAGKLKIGMLLGRLTDASVCKLLAEINDLLHEAIDASRSLTVELSPPVLYHAGLAAALEWLGQQMQQTHGLAVHVQADQTAEPAVEETRVFLFQAVRELLFNTVKHAQAAEARVTMSVADGQQIRIEVADSGQGFDPAQVQAGGSAATGFGLFTIHERLQLLGGRLEVDAAPGRGVRMTIFAPQNESKRAVPRAVLPKPAKTVRHRSTAVLEARADRGSGRIRVLVADDHRILREGLIHLLSAQPDIELVGEASDGQMAVELALSARPDVVVMDVTMPHLDGIEATRRILAELPNTLVVGLSMHEQQSMAAAMYAAGAAIYLPKDGPADALIKAIRSSTDPAAGQNPLGILTP